MVENILEYPISIDAYYRLWLVAHATTSASSTSRACIRHHQGNWHPELVSLFNDVRDVPAMIEVSNGEHQSDSEGRFHTGNNKPTISADYIELWWGTLCGRADKSSLVNPVRANGPCHIKLEGVKVWHHQDQLHRRRGDAVIVQQATFEWNDRENTKGTLRREGGPFQVVLSQVTAKAQLTRTDGGEVEGVPYKLGFRKLTSSWATHDGARLGESRVKEVLSANDIKANYLLAGDSVFADDGEEFIFWSEIGGDL